MKKNGTVIVNASCHLFTSLLEVLQRVSYSEKRVELPLI